jgi:hypothetical protein
MRNGVLRRALGLTLLYFGLFVVIVLVQFSRGPGFSAKAGGLSVNASYPKASRQGAAPDSVRLAAAGIVLEISPKYPAEIVGANGSSRRLAPSSVEKIPDGARVKLSQGVEILALAGKGADKRVVFSASAPDAASALRLHFSASRDARFSQAQDRMSFSSAGASYDLSLGGGAIDPAAGIITLRPGDIGITIAKLLPVAPVKPTVAGSGEALAVQAPKDPEVFKAEISAWRDKVWSGLSASRFDSEKLVWKGSDAAPSFSERALAAYIAEAAARGYYSDALARVKSVKDKWPDKIGYLTAPYLGGLQAKMKVSESADIAEAKRLSQLLADKSPSILEKEDLLKFLVDRSSKDLSDDAIKYIAGLDPAKLTVRQAVGYLDCAVDSALLVKDGEGLFAAAGVAADRLISAARKTPTGCYLVTEDDGSTDLRLSLVAGTVLSTYGYVSSKPSLVGAGQCLVEGVLGLADAQGFGPSRVIVASGQLGQKSGSILPEDIYPIIAGNPYYPHEVSFARDIERGVWVWTCAPALTVQASSAGYSFKASLATGRSHYMACYGIKPFKNIQLYDIDYSPDNDFESYDASGYLYHKDTKTLYMKIKHKKDIEDIKLFF